MCGFSGFYGSDDYDRAAVVDAMGERIVHRGPDSAAHFVDDAYAVAFRRLSIIDLAGGTQPMKSADGRYVITFNGEIYNYRDIREVLVNEHGCTFATDSDTEVLLQTYITWGPVHRVHRVHRVLRLELRSCLRWKRWRTGSLHSRCRRR